jgi:hypothetical protein
MPIISDAAKHPIVDDCGVESCAYCNRISSLEMRGEKCALPALSVFAPCALAF